MAGVDNEKSDYELFRESNIRRNMEVMRALGLNNVDFELHALHSEEKKVSKEKMAKKRKREEEILAVKNVRRSSRISGGATEHQELTVSPYNISGCKAPMMDHALAEAEHRWAGKQNGTSIVGTASYAHTLYRVRTMSEKALENRIKVIERAKGQHAVVKMRLFARVLCLEKYEDLAAKATEALQRLITVLGDVTENP